MLAAAHTPGGYGGVPQKVGKEFIGDADDASNLDELGIARAMVAGAMDSPQKYENLWLFALRITGTGLAYRSGLDEHVWRDKSLYLNDDFLARCAGLSVIWVHPDKAVLTSKEFGDRIIGSVFLPYIKGEDVWAIVKIYDASSAKAMMSEQMSTSPTVVFRDPTVNSTIETEDGKKILVEGKPSLLDHVAIVPLGVWDKSGPPMGVLNNRLEERADSMAESEEDKKAREEREDAARRDAGGAMEKFMDAQSKFMDGMTRRMDAMEADAKARKDAEEKDKEEKKDAARKDAKARRDAERADWAKEDPEGCEKEDAAETAECDKMKKDGEDEERAEEKARNARKDRVKARKDAMEAEADKKRKDAEEEEKKKADAARADSESASYKERYETLAASLARMPMSPDDPNAETMADFQSRADEAYQAFGRRAPPPQSGETPIGYRRRLANGLKTHSADWKAVELRGISDDVLALAERKIYADAVTASKSADDLAEGVLVARTRRTDAGHTVIEYRGRDTIFKQFSSPPLYATAFLTNQKGA